jgi:hypothetical protein
MPVRKCLTLQDSLCGYDVNFFFFFYERLFIGPNTESKVSLIQSSGTPLLRSRIIVALWRTCKKTLDPVSQWEASFLYQVLKGMWELNYDKHGLNRHVCATILTRMTLAGMSRYYKHQHVLQLTRLTMLLPAWFIAIWYIPGGDGPFMQIRITSMAHPPGPATLRRTPSASPFLRNPREKVSGRHASKT